MRHEIPQKEIKYLKLLAKSYPSVQSVCTEIINSQAILNLPKGTEHFMSDLHGEYEAFFHILNNCSGVIREKVRLLFGGVLSHKERSALCMLIYYPEEKLERLKKEKKLTKAWYKTTLMRLIELARLLSSKYTRSKVRKAIPEEYAYIIDELLHAQPDEDNNQLIYHQKIIDTLITIESGDGFIIALARLIKRLAVDHLHIVGDIFDRGPRPDAILDMLMALDSVDIEWGNHDILWMGAAAGSEACMAAVVRNCLAYDNMEVLESGYGISLRSLMLYAQQLYPAEKPEIAALREISIIMFKLEGQLIRRRPELKMDAHLLLDKVDLKRGSVMIGDTEYAMVNFPAKTIDPDAPYALNDAEAAFIAALKKAFLESERLQRHVRFLYAKGSMYRIHNGNLLFHGCVPLDQNGNFLEMRLGGKRYAGRAYMDYMDKVARKAYFQRDDFALDCMWFLWCGDASPLCGRQIKTFPRAYCLDQATWQEPQNPYYQYHTREETCIQILREFGLDNPSAHIINGHTPIKVSKGENPVKANGKLVVIDGGFCRAYQKTTGIAGYTLIYNSHGLRIMSHQPFTSIGEALDENKDIHSHSEIFETAPRRMMVSDCDNGKVIQEKIKDLELLLAAYRQGVLTPAR